MIQIVQGFRVSTRDPIDNRILLTKAEMVTINDNQMPDKYFAVCKDDGTLYLYDKSREPSAETGKFVQYSSSKIESISVDGEVLPINLGNIDLPLATAEKYGLAKFDLKGFKSENGFISLDFNTLDDYAIPFEKVDLRDVVIDGSNININ